jgi:hypothetical protein
MTEPRRRVDLTGLPAWAQYILAATVAATVALAIWATGTGQPAPSWYLVSIAVAAIILLAAGLLWLGRRLTRRD